MEFKSEYSEILNEILETAAENNYGDISQHTNPIMEIIEILENLEGEEYATN